MYGPLYRVQNTDPEDDNYTKFGWVQRVSFTSLVDVFLASRLNTPSQTDVLPQGRWLIIYDDGTPANLERGDDLFGAGSPLVQQF